MRFLNDRRNNTDDVLESVEEGRTVSHDKRKDRDRREDEISQYFDVVKSATPTFAAHAPNPSNEQHNRTTPIAGRPMPRDGLCTDIAGLSSHQPQLQHVGTTNEEIARHESTSTGVRSYLQHDNNKADSKAQLQRSTPALKVGQLQSDHSRQPQEIFSANMASSLANLAHDESTTEEPALVPSQMTATTAEDQIPKSVKDSTRTYSRSSRTVHVGLHKNLLQTFDLKTPRHCVVLDGKISSPPFLRELLRACDSAAERAEAHAKEQLWRETIQYNVWHPKQKVVDMNEPSRSAPVYNFEDIGYTDHDTNAARDLDYLDLEQTGFGAGQIYGPPLCGAEENDCMEHNIFAGQTLRHSRLHPSQRLQHSDRVEDDVAGDYDEKLRVLEYGSIPELGECYDEISGWQQRDFVNNHFEEDNIVPPDFWCHNRLY